MPSRAPIRHCASSGPARADQAPSPGQRHCGISLAFDSAPCALAGRNGSSLAVARRWRRPGRERFVMLHRHVRHATAGCLRGTRGFEGAADQRCHWNLAGIGTCCCSRHNAMQGSRQQWKAVVGQQWLLDPCRWAQRGGNMWLRLLAHAHRGPWHKSEQQLLWSQAQTTPVACPDPPASGLLTPRADRRPSRSRPPRHARPHQWVWGHTEDVPFPARASPWSSIASNGSLQSKGSWSIRPPWCWTRLMLVAGLEMVED